jgi:hypothetical protein
LKPPRDRQTQPALGDHLPGEAAGASLKLDVIVDMQILSDDLPGEAARSPVR